MPSGQDSKPSKSWVINRTWGTYLSVLKSTPFMLRGWKPSKWWHCTIPARPTPLSSIENTNGEKWLEWLYRETKNASLYTVIKQIPETFEIGQLRTKTSRWMVSIRALRWWGLWYGVKYHFAEPWKGLTLIKALYSKSSSGDPDQDTSNLVVGNEDQ